jgi:hypothetical protein
MRQTTLGWSESCELCRKANQTSAQCRRCGEFVPVKLWYLGNPGNATKRLLKPQKRISIRQFALILAAIGISGLTQSLRKRLGVFSLASYDQALKWVNLTAVSLGF